MEVGNWRRTSRSEGIVSKSNTESEAVFKGKVLSQSEDGDALVQVGERTVKASIQGKVAQGETTWFQVQQGSTNERMILKVMQGPGADTPKGGELSPAKDALSGAIKQMMQTLDLPDTPNLRAWMAELNQLTDRSAHARSQTPLDKLQTIFSDAVVKWAHAMTSNDSIDRFMQTVSTAVSKNLPVQPNTLNAIHQTLNGPPLTQQLQSLTTAIERQLQTTNSNESKQLLIQVREQLRGLQDTIKSFAHTQAPSLNTSNSTSQTLTGGAISTPTQPTPVQSPIAQSPTAQSPSAQSSPAQPTSAQPSLAQLSTAQSTTGQSLTTQSSTAQSTTAQSTTGQSSTAQSTPTQSTTAQPANTSTQSNSSIQNSSQSNNPSQNPNSMQGNGATSATGQTQITNAPLTANSNLTNKGINSVATSNPINSSSMNTTASNVSTNIPSTSGAISKSVESESFRIPSGDQLQKWFQLVGLLHEKNAQKLHQAQLMNDTQQVQLSKEVESSLKSLMMQISQQSDLDSAVRDLADQITNQITGQQLLLHADKSAINQFSFTIPVFYEQQQSNVSIHVETQSNKRGEWDAENCRVWFDLDLRAMGLTMVDVHIAQKVVRVSVFNDVDGLQDHLDELKPELEHALQEQGYWLSGLKQLAYPTIDHTAESNEAQQVDDSQAGQSNARDNQQVNSQAMQAYRNKTYKGVDLRI